MSALRGEPLWLGIDAGTQSVRAIVVDACGNVVASGAARLASHRQGSRHEQDPRGWRQAAAAAVREALRGVEASAIRALAVDATSGTVVLVDAAGEPLTPGLMYDDTRAAAEAEEVNAAGAGLWSELGYNRMQAAWALPKLLWLHRQHPALPHARFAHQSDVLTRWLVGGPVATDASNALKTGYDLLRECWPAAVFSRLGLDAEAFPVVVRPGAVLGKVGARSAAETGLRPGTLVVAGMTDGCAAQLASGALAPGSWNSVLGTTLVLKGVSSSPLKDPGGVVYSHRAPDGRWLPGGASSAGAAVIAKHFAGQDLDALTQAAARCEPASVVAYPLAGRGERFPFLAPAAEGFVTGRPVDEADHFAAQLQGLAFLERLCLDYLDLIGADVSGEWRLNGGAVANRYWCQLRADVLGRPVFLARHSEAAVGMAMLAAASERPLLEAAAEMAGVREVIEPRPGRRALWGGPFQRFVSELEARGWLPAPLAAHARRRCG